MTIIQNISTLKGLLVQNAMSKKVVGLPAEASLEKSINHLIKYEVDALLVHDGEDIPIGVVSKTDIMGAYYASLPVTTALHDIMSSPVLFCRHDTLLESALDKMRDARVHRLYVLEGGSGKVVGTLSYPDIVWLMHNYCQECKHGLLRRNGSHRDPGSSDRIIVKEVMTTSVKSLSEKEPLTRIMEDLSCYHFGALLIVNNEDLPQGVISKTDLTLSYLKGIDSQLPAKMIMSSPVRSCDENEMLENAVSGMIHRRVSRLFIHRQSPQNISGVLSLSDAARVRSGSCLACMSARIKVEK